MKTILDNPGNRRLFDQCLDGNRRKKERVYSFTVNVFSTPTKRKPATGYGPGFYNGRYKKLGEPTPAYISAYFKSAWYQENIGYRIRVWPKAKGKDNG